MYDPTEWVYIRPNPRLLRLVYNYVWRKLYYGNLPRRHLDQDCKLKVRVDELPAIEKELYAIHERFPSWRENLR